MFDYCYRRMHCHVNIACQRYRNNSVLEPDCSRCSMLWFDDLLRLITWNTHVRIWIGITAKLSSWWSNSPYLFSNFEVQNCGCLDHRGPKFLKLKFVTSTRWFLVWGLLIIGINFLCNSNNNKSDNNISINIFYCQGNKHVFCVLFSLVSIHIL